MDRFGGDRDFVTIAGCSAGGHLAALAGLTPNAPEYQTHLPEGSDTSVDAVVGIYGRYDWEDRSTTERVRFVDFLERVVVKRKIDRHPEIFRDASPIARIHPDAPPFLVVHGTGDTIIPVAQARSFVERLRAVSRSVVSYVELPGAGHGFDMTDGARTGPTATAIGLFLNQIHRNWTSVGAKDAHLTPPTCRVSVGRRKPVKRLSGWDAFLLYSEAPNVHMHTLKIAIIELAGHGWAVVRSRGVPSRHRRPALQAGAVSLRTCRHSDAVPPPDVAGEL